MKTTHLLLATASALLLALSASAQPQKTFCNPLDIVVGQERAYRGGEPVVLIYQDDYYLFVSHRKGYWYSPDFRDWTYVDAPDYPGGVVSVVEMDGTLYGCSMNNKNVFKCIDPKKGQWEKCGTLDSDRYGDANMFYDEGHLYLYYGWSQIMPFKVVELDKKTFKEISEPKVLFFGDYKKHGFESRRNEDVIYSIFNGRRDYFAEEYPWIEGPWMTKHNGKYYLQYAAIGLEFLSYSHGVYVGDSPTGPFTYSQHNPLTFKTTGFQVGAGHGSTFHDKNGDLWTICMIPGNYGGGRGSELALYRTDVDKDGVMHSDTALGDWPQFWPGTRPATGVHNWTGWMLLSNKKKVEVSSTFENYTPSKGVDEDFMTCWAAETGDPGEYFCLDLGKVADIRAIQVNFDHIGAAMPQRGGFGFGPQPTPEHYQCYTVEVSTDKVNWTTVESKPDNKQEFRHVYFELPAVKARYVKVTNLGTYDDAKFCIKDLRVFGNPSDFRVVDKICVVKGVKVVRNPEDRREATLLWDPVPGADGYIVRYGLSKKKLYNSYIVYDTNFLKLHSLNTESDYVFQVESFDSGLDYYREKTEEVNGIGAEVEINKRGNGNFGYGGNALSKRVMLKEGVDEYEFEGIEPGHWVINHTFGPVLWDGELTAEDLIGEGEPGIEAKLTELGAGTTVTGELRMKVVRGPDAGKVVLNIIRY